MKIHLCRKNSSLLNILSNYEFIDVYCFETYIENATDDSFEIISAEHIDVGLIEYLYAIVFNLSDADLTYLKLMNNHMPDLYADNIVMTFRVKEKIKSYTDKQ